MNRQQKLLSAIIFVAVTSLVGQPLFAQYNDVLVGNRSAGTFSVIDIDTLGVETFNLPGAANPNEPMYFSYSPTNDLVYVGDRGNDRLVIFNANDYTTPLGEVAVGAGIFHQWADVNKDQIWVNNDIDDTISIVGLSNSNVIATIAAPADLVAQGGQPHDVYIDPDNPFAYVTMLGVAGAEDFVVKYSTNTFNELDRVAVGNDPHVTRSSLNGNLYVPTQGGNDVHVLNLLFDLEDTIDTDNSHGAFMSADGTTLFTTNISDGGTDGLIVIDTVTNSVINMVDTPFSTPHNVILDRTESLLFVSHSGVANDMISIFDTSDLRNPVFLTSVQADSNPFGLLVVSNVPEPGSSMIFCVGAIVCCCRRRR